MRLTDRRRPTVTTASRARLGVGVLLALALVGVLATTAAGAPVGQTRRDVFRIADLFGPPPPEAVGSSTLVRTDRGVSTTLETTGLTAGHVVTLWWVVFNDPDGCQAGIPNVSRCGHDDALAGRGGVSPNHAAGRIVDEDGTARFGAHLRVGDTSGALAGPGLLNPRDAEVIPVLKTHGPKIAHLVSDQLHTFAGGCADQSDAPPATPPERLGRPGPNDCAEIHVSVHAPAS
ncbi:MAG: hypothetical protein ACRD29_03125 [Acidimicrobiales bacterium]